jgi:hypothetical protein
MREQFVADIYFQVVSKTALDIRDNQNYLESNESFLSPTILYDKEY